MRASGSHVVQGRERDSELGMKTPVTELVSSWTSWATPRSASGECEVNAFKVLSQRSGPKQSRRLGDSGKGVFRASVNVQRSRSTPGERHGDARWARKPQSLGQSSPSADAQHSESKTSPKAKRVLGRRIGHDQELRNKCPGSRSAFMGERFSSLMACLVYFCLLPEPFKVLSMF